MKKKKKNPTTVEKRSVGRPSKLTAELASKIMNLARRGFTDKETAELLTFPGIFHLTPQTINNWKHDPEFFDTLKSNKKFADSLIERSLFERGIGYTHPETKVFCHEGDIVTHEMTKIYPPDVTACIFWLKNRDPKQWREAVEHNHKLSLEQLVAGSMDEKSSNKKQEKENGKS